VQYERIQKTNTGVTQYSIYDVHVTYLNIFCARYDTKTMKDIDQKFITKFIRKICVGKSKEEMKQAEANYLRFIRLAERVNNRLSKERNGKS